MYTHTQVYKFTHTHTQTHTHSHKFKVEVLHYYPSSIPSWLPLQSTLTIKFEPPGQCQRTAYIFHSNHRTSL